jgi:hypothetical protein
MYPLSDSVALSHPMLPDPGKRAKSNAPLKAIRFDFLTNAA